MRPHLLVTNDFPPKVGGIQNYLWELWRRLPAAGAPEGNPPNNVTVLTTPYSGAAAFDADQPIRVVRDRDRVLLPHPWLAKRIRQLAEQAEAELVIYDPALPLGALAKRVGLPYGLVLHGAEITVPARLPGLKQLLARVFRGAELIISAGGYAAAEAQRCAKRELPIVEIPPGVDSQRFVPLTPQEKVQARQRFGLRPEAPLVVGTSRLVPRKGFDRLIVAVGLVRHSTELAHLQLAIAGAGRDRRRLETLAEKHEVPVKFLGRVSDEALPAVMGMGDVFAMPCRDRWAGLEQEGFGIVYLEAAAAGVCSVAGRSGGSYEAVEDGATGIVLKPVGKKIHRFGRYGARSQQTGELEEVLVRLLSDRPQLAAMSEAARQRAVDEFDYDLLARKLRVALS